MTDGLDLNTLYSQYVELETDRTEWITEWRNISEYLLPGRGLYTRMTKPPKRKLTSPKVVNTTGEDALYVLTSGMHGGLTSPTVPWFRLNWAQQELNQFEPLKAWLQDCNNKLHGALHASNFYSTINSFYTEYAGFGNGCQYVGSDTDSDAVPFRFELLTAGEYVFSMGADGRPDAFFRIIFRSPKQVYDQWPDTCSSDVKKVVEDHDPQMYTQNVVILEGVLKRTYNDKAYTQVYYEMGAGNTAQQKFAPLNKFQKPLEVQGFYEFPYPIARWNTIGNDTLGIGPGSRALPDIKRLQEMEKAALMATHKAIDPPLNVPARMRNQLNTLPGGANYYAHPDEQVNQLYAVRFDYKGVELSVNRVEQRIQRVFFNDIFLTGSRDPNASPYKAAEVHAREQEKMLRLGPVIERLQHEFLTPMIERCFNIMLRKGLFQPLPPDLAKMAGDYEIRLLSPLAIAQKAVSLQGINSFLAFIGQAAQFDQSIMDNVNADEAARQYADITGVELGVLRPQAEVDKIRKERAARLEQERKQQEAIAIEAAKAEIEKQQASASKDRASAGETLISAQTQALGAGIN